jgi:hypothetical protein
MSQRAELQNDSVSWPGRAALAAAALRPLALGEAGGGKAIAVASRVGEGSDLPLKWAGPGHFEKFENKNKCTPRREPVRSRQTPVDPVWPSCRGGAVATNPCRPPQASSSAADRRLFVTRSCPAQVIHASILYSPALVRSIETLCVSQNTSLQHQRHALNASPSLDVCHTHSLWATRSLTPNYTLSLPWPQLPRHGCFRATRASGKSSSTSWETVRLVSRYVLCYR